MVYLPTFTIKINQMQVNIPYMDPMGMNLIISYDTDFTTAEQPSHFPPEKNQRVFHGKVEAGKSFDSKICGLLGSISHKIHGIYIYIYLCMYIYIY